MNGYHNNVPGPEVPYAMLTEWSQQCDDYDTICIAGCGFGRDVHFLMEQLNRDHTCYMPKLYAFDTFGEIFGSEHFEGLPEFTPWGEPFGAWAARVGGPGRLIDHFAVYLRNSPAREYLTDWAQFPHWTVAEEFKDNSISFVLANGSHQPANVMQELTKWWPKIKAGGQIGLYGHDAADFNTKLAVAREFFTVQKAKSLDVAANHAILTR